MDGFRLVYLFKVLTLVLAFSSPVLAFENRCAWSSANQSPEDIKATYEKIKESAAGTCVDVNPNLHLGAKQALAIAAKSCAQTDEASLSDAQFLYQAMKLQGLKLSDAQNILKPSDFNPANLFKNAKSLNCLEQVTPEQDLQKGDVLVNHHSAIMIDRLGKDPFGIDKKIASLASDPAAKLESHEASVIVAKTKSVCADLLGDFARKFGKTEVASNEAESIWVLHGKGHRKLFPYFGHTSSAWLTTVSEWGETRCREKVSQELARLNSMARPDLAVNARPAGAILVLRHQTQKPSCHTEVFVEPGVETVRANRKTDDADCVRFCNFKEDE